MGSGLAAAEEDGLKHSKLRVVLSGSKAAHPARPQPSEAGRGEQHSSKRHYSSPRSQEWPPLKTRRNSAAE